MSGTGTKVPRAPRIESRTSPSSITTAIPPVCAFGKRLRQQPSGDQIADRFVLLAFGFSSPAGHLHEFNIGDGLHTASHFDAVFGPYEIAKRTRPTDR